MTQTPAQRIAELKAELTQALQDGLAHKLRADELEAKLKIMNAGFDASCQSEDDLREILKASKEEINRLKAQSDAHRDAQIKAEAALSGRTVSCVCGGKNEQS